MCPNQLYAAPRILSPFLEKAILRIRRLVSDGHQYLKSPRECRYLCSTDARPTVPNWVRVHEPGFGEVTDTFSASRAVQDGCASAVRHIGARIATGRPGFNGFRPWRLLLFGRHDGIFECLRQAEFHHRLGRNLDGLAGLEIAVYAALGRWRPQSSTTGY